MSDACDLLLVSGQSWIDDIRSSLYSLAVIADTEYAADHGEQLHLVAVGGIPCSVDTVLAFRSWGLFASLNYDFMKAHFAGTPQDILTAIASCITTRGCVETLKEVLDLRPYDWRAFQRTGITATLSLLNADGWRELSETEESAIRERHRLAFHPGIFVEEVFPTAAAENQLVEISTNGMRELFKLDRKAFWKLENDVRTIFSDILEEYGAICKQLFVFCVNHGTYAIERPTNGWGIINTYSWPVHLLNCSGDVLVFAPDIQEGFALNEVRREMVAAGQLTSSRIGQWEQSRQ